MYRIEQPLPPDYDHLIKIWESSVRATHHFLAEDDLQFYKKLIREKYFALVQLYAVLSNDNSRFCAFAGTANGNLEMLFVDASARGKGLGKLLLQHVVSNAGVTRVDVNQQNTQAIAFYRRHGFHEISRSAQDGTGKPYPIIHMELKGDYPTD